MDRVDWYFRQKVSESELDLAFDQTEAADRAQNKDAGLVGIMAGLSPTPAAPPDLTASVGAGTAYSKDGARMRLASNQTVDLSKTWQNVSTAVTTPGNSRVIGVYLQATRALSDPRTDGNNDTVYFRRSEAAQFKVVMGAEAPVPAPPALDASNILLFDVVRAYGQTTLDIGDFKFNRTEALVRVGDAPISVVAYTLKDALHALASALKDHVIGDDLFHDADDISYAGGPAWADGETNPAQNVESVLDVIIGRLASKVSSSSGARKVGVEGITSGSFTIPAGTAFAALNTLVGWVATLNGLVGKLAGSNTWSADNTFTAQVFGDNGLWSFTPSTATDGTVLTSTAGLAYQALGELVTVAVSRRLRVYYKTGAAGGLRVTFNAKFTSLGTWTRDDVNQGSWMLDADATALIFTRYANNAAASVINMADPGDEVGRFSVTLPSGSLGSPWRTGIGPGGNIATNAGSASAHLFRRYTAAGGGGEGVFVPFGKTFTVAPSTVSISAASATNVFGGVGGIALLGHASGVKATWVSGGAGLVEVEGDILAS